MTLIPLFKSFLNHLPYRGVGKTRDQKEIVTIRESAISNMLEIGALRELLFEKGILTEDEFIAKFEKDNRKMR